MHTVVGNIINNNYPVCATIVGRCDGTESFLAYQQRQSGVIVDVGQNVPAVSHWTYYIIGP